MLTIALRLPGRRPLTAKQDGADKRVLHPPGLAPVKWCCAEHWIQPRGPRAGQKRSMDCRPGWSQVIVPARVIFALDPETGCDRMRALNFEPRARSSAG